MARKEYVSLFEKLAAEGGDTVSKPSSKDPPMPLTQEEKRRLDVLEEELPLQTIIMFRSMARNEVRRRRRCCLMLSFLSPSLLSLLLLEL